MTTHLAELYKCQGRSTELFRLLIEEGQLRPAFDLAVAGKFQDGIQESEIKTAFNLLHAEKLSWDQVKEPSPPFPLSNWKTILPHYLHSASAGWNAVSRVIDLMKKGRMSGALTEVQNELVMECLCLHVSTVFLKLS